MNDAPERFVSSVRRCSGNNLPESLGVALASCLSPTNGFANWLPHVSMFIHSYCLPRRSTGIQGIERRSVRNREARKEELPSANTCHAGFAPGITVCRTSAVRKLQQRSCQRIFMLSTVRLWHKHTSCATMRNDVMDVVGPAALAQVVNFAPVQFVS